jgi:hypothetical protein
MIRLSDGEITCLRRIADEPSTADPPCADEVLKRLQDLGLVEPGSKLWAPLEAVDVRYRLTAFGQAFLKRMDEVP